MKVTCVQCAETKEMDLNWSCIGEFFCCAECVKMVQKLNSPVPLPQNNVIYVDFKNRKREVA